jgi:hypothetical protein
MSKLEIDIERDLVCVTTPAIQDGEIVKLSVMAKKYLEIEIEKKSGKKYQIHISGLLKFGVTELVDGAGILEAFYSEVSEINNFYVDRSTGPWKIMNQSICDDEYLEKSERRFIENNPEAIYFWIECNSSGYIAAAGKSIRAYEI